LGDVPRALSALLAIAVLGWAARAQAEEIAAPEAPQSEALAPVFHPDGPGPWRWRIAGGALMDILPTRVVENQIRQVPMLTANARIGLPAQFSADVRLAAIVITNQLELGVGWTGHIKDLSFALINHIGVWYGYIGVEGFDATGFGSLDQPGIVLGVPWQRTRFSLAFEGIVTLGQHTRLGDSQTLSRSKVQIVGGSAMLVVESALPSGGMPYFGVGVIRAVPNAQAWVAFSDSNARYPYPRFVAGYEF
jgi:hypothetical protein